MLLIEATGEKTTAGVDFSCIVKTMKKTANFDHLLCGRNSSVTLHILSHCTLITVI